MKNTIKSIVIILAVMVSMPALVFAQTTPQFIYGTSMGTPATSSFVVTPPSPGAGAPIPMLKQYSGGLPVLTQSNLVDTGTVLLYKNSPIGVGATPIYKGTLTSAATTLTGTITITGVTTSMACWIAPSGTTLTAAQNTAGIPALSATAANTVTYTFAVGSTISAGWTYNVFCN